MNNITITRKHKGVSVRNLNTDREYYTGKQRNTLLNIEQYWNHKEKALQALFVIEYMLQV